jgi:hypothetical protein
LTENSQVVEVKSEGKLVLKEPGRREDLLSMLDRVIEECYTKFKGRYCKNAEKLAWARALGLLAKVSNDLLRDFDLESLQVRIERLERGETHEQR